MAKIGRPATSKIDDYHYKCKYCKEVKYIDDMVQTKLWDRIYICRECRGTIDKNKDAKRKADHKRMRSCLCCGKKFRTTANRRICIVCKQRAVFRDAETEYTIIK